MPLYFREFASREICEIKDTRKLRVLQYHTDTNSAIIIRMYILTTFRRQETVPSCTQKFMFNIKMPTYRKSSTAQY